MLLQKPHHWSCLCHHSSKAQRYLYSKFIHLNLNSHLACICLHYQLFLTYFGCIGLASRGKRTIKMEVVVDTIVPSFSLMNESFPYLNMLCQTCLSSSNKTEPIFQENNFKRSFHHAFISSLVLHRVY